VVVLIDGLGYDLLRQRSGHAPFLRGLLPGAARLSAGFPSTTATSMGTFGTGLRRVLTGWSATKCSYPARTGCSTSCPGTMARTHVCATEPNRLRAGRRRRVAVTRIGPGFFDGSGLTTAALRGGTFTAARSLDERVDSALAAARASRRALVYLYWGSSTKWAMSMAASPWSGATSWS